MTIKELLFELKKARHMTELQWRQFCLRYATRDTTTVEWALRAQFGKLPEDAETAIAKALIDILSEA